MASRHVLNFLRGSFKSRAYSGETRIAANHSHRNVYAVEVHEAGVNVIFRLSNGYVTSCTDTPDDDIYSEPEDIEDIEARLALMREIKAVMPLLKHLHSLPEDAPMPDSTQDDAAIQYISDLLGSRLSSVRRLLGGSVHFYLTRGARLDVLLFRAGDKQAVRVSPWFCPVVPRDTDACRECASAYRQLADCLELLERCLPDIEAKL